MSLFHRNTYLHCFGLGFFYILNYHQACAIVNTSWGILFMFPGQACFALQEYRTFMRAVQQVDCY